MIDYIIVGCGLAGIAFAERALSEGKTVMVFEDSSQNSSTVAAGLYNPVILKRFSAISQAQSQLDAMNLFYDRIETLTSNRFNYKLPVLRKFFSAEEQNNWFAASDKESLAPFLSPRIISSKFTGIDSPYGFGEVLQTGYVNTKPLLDFFRKFLVDTNRLRTESFSYSELIIGCDYVSYRDLQARHIVFAEGFGLHANPFFNHLPLDGTKGELFIIEAPDLSLDVILNTSIFILPLGNALFKVGATYNWDDKSADPTPEGKEELLEKISGILTCSFRVVEHLAGVRPTVKDRKALLGTHPQYPLLHILNGLGTRGVMLAPEMAKTLFDHIESGMEVPREVSIKRFKAF